MPRPLSYYDDKWNNMVYTRKSAIDVAAQKIIAFKDRYKGVERTTGVPWEWVGAAHMRESNNNFRGVLHNGEHIIGTGRRTRLVPRGRGPFSSWEQAADDALAIKGLKGKPRAWWTPSQELYQHERFNGWGYAARGKPSPYVLAGTQFYTRGKYVRDGVYSASTVDPQLGTAPVMKRVRELVGTTRIPGSRRQGVVRWLRRFVEVTGLGTILDWSTVNQIQPFLSQNQLVIALIFGVILWIGLKYIEKAGAREYAEGRYITRREYNDVAEFDPVVPIGEWDMDLVGTERLSPSADPGAGGGDLRPKGRRKGRRSPVRSRRRPAKPAR